MARTDRRKTATAFTAAVAAGLVTCFVPLAQAQTAVQANWTTPFDGGSWTEPSNWDTGVYPTGLGSTATFPNPAGVRNITMDGNIVTSGITVTNTTGTVTTFSDGSAGSNLTFDSSTAGPVLVTVNGANSAFNSALVNFGATNIFNKDVEFNVTSTAATGTAGSALLGGLVSGSGGFIKSGPGRMTFAFTPANNTNFKTYTGATVINGGRLRMSLNARPTATSAVTVNTGGQWTLISAGTYAFPAATVITLNGSGPTTGPDAIFPGAVRPDTGLNQTLNNPVVLGSDALIHVQGAVAGVLTLSNTVTGNGGLIFEAPNSNADLGKLVLSNSGNAWLGGTTVNGGTLDSSAGKISTGALTVNVVDATNAQATVLLNTSSANTVGSLSGSFINSGNGATGRSITVNNGGQLLTVNQTAAGTYAGNIVGAGGLTKTGSSQLTLSGTNTYAGATSVNAGTLLASLPASLPGYTTAGQVSVASGGTLGVVAGASNWTATAINDAYSNANLPAGSNFAIDTTPGDFSYGTSMGKANGFTKLGANKLTLTSANTYSGGTTVFAGTLVLGNADATAGGAINVGNGAVAQAQASLPKAVTVTSLTTNASGKFDLTNNSMVVKGMPDSAVRTLLQAGYNAGAWNGPTGIVSTSITPETSIGYATKLQTGITDFKGVTGMADTDVQVKFTYAGDANLDGKVDIGDLGLLAGAWQAASGKVWFDGDFTYDGAVDIGDLGLLSGNWQKGTAGNPNPPLMDFAQAMAQFSAFDGVVVPEPTSLGLLGVAGVGLLARRRRTA